MRLGPVWTSGVAWAGPPVHTGKGLCYLIFYFPGPTGGGGRFAGAFVIFNLESGNKSGLFIFLFF